MRRGTTPTHTFKISKDTSELCKIRVTYSQLGRAVIVKHDSDMTLDGECIIVKLTQAETLSFRAQPIVEIQIKGLDEFGEVWLSPILQETMERCVNEEELV
jgi:hypothetical protein